MNFKLSESLNIETEEQKYPFSSDSKSSTNLDFDLLTVSSNDLEPQERMWKENILTF